MNDRDIRLECVRLAIGAGERGDRITAVAQEFAAFVIGRPSLDVRHETDPLRLFLAAQTIMSVGAQVRSAELYDAFVEWCALTGKKPWSAKAFSRAMIDAGYRKIVADGVWWIGIRLRDGGKA